jgi:hypothetical protein
MRRSTRFAALLAATAIVAGLAGLPAQAQRADAAKLAAARELVDATGGIAMAERVVDEMITGMVQQMRLQNPSVATEFERIMRTVMSPNSPKVKAYFNDIIEVTTQFYAEKFTIDELRQLTAFQRSPVGQKFQKVVPEAMSRMTPVIMKFQNSIAPDVQAASQRAMQPTK